MKYKENWSASHHKMILEQIAICYKVLSNYAIIILYSITRHISAMINVVMQVIKTLQNKFLLTMEKKLNLYKLVLV